MLRRAMLCFVLLTIVGCGAPDGVTITQWSVEGKPATLPGNVAPLLPARGGTIRMEADVPVPPELRGASFVSLTTNVQWCSPILFANGVRMDDVERSPLDGVRSQGPHLYRIPGDLAGERLALRFEIADTYEYCSLWQNAPVLSRHELGPRSYVIVRHFNHVAPVIALSVLALVGAAIIVLYFTGGRRPAHLWAGCVCLFATGNPLGFLGFSHYVLGHWGDALYEMTSLPCQLAGIHFACAYLERPPPSKVWNIVVGCAVVAAPLTMQRYDERLMWAVTQPLSIVLYVKTLWILARYRRRSQNGPFLLAAMVAFMPLFFVESMALYGLPDPIQGAHIAYLGFVLLTSAMLVAFMRDHGAAATDLRSELAAARKREAEVLGLSDELRHQVAQRSRELRDVLVRTEGILAPSPPTVGDLFEGRYKVLRELGSGGMGAVYEVERRTDGQHFALKVITGPVTGQGAARFAREAEIGARTRHRNLVSIVDVGIARSSTPFLVMELVRGGSIDSERARFGDEAWARPLLAQVAEALVALHAGGIVHRDLKPANVLLEDGQLAKVADFGISRFDDASAPMDALGATKQVGAEPNLTGTGMMMGTPLYMAPESAAGEVGPASDVFSFGVMAYEMLVGRPAFATPPVILAMAKQELPTPAGERTGVMGSVLACLAQDPTARPTAEQLVAALR